MAESSFRRYIIKGLRGAGGIAQAHEDTCAAGIADVSFTLAGGLSGWIEVKVLDAWPARMSTCINIPHLTEEQVEFLKERGKRGAPCYLALRVWRDYCFIPWQYAEHVHHRTMTVQDIKFIAVCYEGKVDWPHLVGCIKQVGGKYGAFNNKN